MKKIDVKHIAYHVMIGLYFVWLVVFGALITMALANVFGQLNYELSKVFLLWIFFNLIMGTVLFIVIRLFRNGGIVSRVVLYSYYFIATISVISAFIISKYS